MKRTWRIYVIAFAISVVGALVLPVITLAKPIGAFAESIDDKPNLNQLDPAERERIRQKKQQAKEAAGEDTQLNKPVLKPDAESALETANSDVPKQNFSTGLDKHQHLLQRRLERLDQFDRLPEDKRAFLAEHFQAEIDWLADARSRSQAATTDDERAAIRTEMRDHFKTVQAERRTELAKTVTLPDQVPADRSEAVTQHFSTIITKLATAGVDVAESEQLFSNYQAAMATLTNAQTATEAEKTVENIQALKTAIQDVRAASVTLRNQLQSLLLPQQTTNT